MVSNHNFAYLFSMMAGKVAREGNQAYSPSDYVKENDFFRTIIFLSRPVKIVFISLNISL
jgi:hypothetical protein